MEPIDYRPEKKGMVEIHVSLLKVGMFVADVDCGWLSTPYLVQGLLIRKLDDIEILSRYARYVWIDPIKGDYQVGTSLQRLDVAHKAKTKITRKKVLEEDAHLSKHKVQYVKEANIVEEHPIALSLYEKGKKGIYNIVSDVVHSSKVDVVAARELVSENMKSILRNPDALLWMTKIRNMDEYTAEHCLNVSILAMVFGRHLGLTESDLLKVGLAGLLHDLGKLETPPHILNKPDKLTPEEMLIMCQHPLMGYELLKDNKSLPKVVVSTALSHHERIDGNGYPHGISADELSEIVRLVTIVDTYDAMTSERCYSKPKSTTEALKILYDEKGKQFDELLVLEFIKCIGIYPPGVIVELINGSVGMVIEVNEGFRHLPKVLLLREQGGALSEPCVIDLLMVEQGSLSNEYLVKRTLGQGTYGIYTKDYTY